MTAQQDRTGNHYNVSRRMATASVIETIYGVENNGRRSFLRRSVSFEVGDEFIASRQ